MFASVNRKIRRVPAPIPARLPTIPEMKTVSPVRISAAQVCREFPPADMPFQPPSTIPIVRQVPVSAALEPCEASVSPRSGIPARAITGSAAGIPRPMAVPAAYARDSVRSGPGRTRVRGARRGSGAVSSLRKRRPDLSARCGQGPHGTEPTSVGCGDRTSGLRETA